MPVHKTLFVTALTCLVLSFAACNSAPLRDHPRLTAKVHLLDETFYSQTLGHSMRLRIVLPQNPTLHRPPAVVYVLHGAGANLHDWTSNSDIAAFAEENIVLVFPDAPDSFYIDEAAEHLPYERYFLRDLIPEVHRLVPHAATDRSRTGIVGISRGGYGAVVLGLHHPETFSFIGSLSGALDLAERPLRIQSPLQSLALRRAFGPAGDPTHASNDPFLLGRSAPSLQVPYFFIGCGAQDPLLSTNRRFAAILATRSLPSEFHTVPGAHNWGAWNEQIPLLKASLIAHLSPVPRQTP